MKEPEFHNSQGQSSPPDKAVLPEGMPQKQTEVTIGSLLKRAREKKSLSHAQISEILRLKPHIIQAIEDEDWTKLPSPVLASGFVRSYGRILGLKDEHINMLFQSSRPAYTPILEPLVTPTKNKNTTLIILILCALLLIPAYFFWQGRVDRLKRQSSPVTTESAVDSSVQTQSIQDTPVSNGLAAPIEQNPSEPDAFLDAIPLESNETVPGADPVESQESAAQDAPTPETLSARDQANETDTMNLSLSLMFHDTTWVRIFVDDREPKEYIFQAEERRQWRAKNGFELVIGNAGATELVLNGKRVDLPDMAGKVVRLNLPEGYKKENIQN